MVIKIPKKGVITLEAGTSIINFCPDGMTISRRVEYLLRNVHFFSLQGKLIGMEDMHDSLDV